MGQVGGAPKKKAESAGLTEEPGLDIFDLAKEKKVRPVLFGSAPPVNLIRKVCGGKSQLAAEYSSYVIAPNKIFTLNLDPFELAAFFALASHGGKSSSGIFPSWPRLRAMTGMSRDKLWKCLLTLEQCNVIRWDRGRTGRANNYQILGSGCWSKKNGDKVTGQCGKRGGTSPSHGLPTSPSGGLHQSVPRTTGSPPDGLQPVPIEQDQLTTQPETFSTEETPMSFAALIERISEKTKGLDAEQVKKIIDRDWSACESDRNP